MPKVIDFGIAKALHHQLTEETLTTEFRQIMGTAAYMSPEQANLSALDIDTRSDVYSLGVLFYELLVGKTPIEGGDLVKAGYAEMQRQILEVEPPRLAARWTRYSEEERTQIAEGHDLPPHKLMSFLHGELDWIAMKALEKDRRRRYDSAQAFADDVERYLQDEPVIARKPSPMYRARKFAVRNRRWLAPAAFVFAVLLGVMGYAQWQERRVLLATRERAQETFANFYSSEISRAGHLLEIGAIEHVPAILDRFRPDSLKPGERDWRDFTWSYLREMENGPFVRQTVPGTSAVWSIDVAPDGSQFATAQSDGMGGDFHLQITDGATLDLIHRIDLPAKPLFVCYGDGGSLLAAGYGPEKTVGLWSLRSASSQTPVKLSREWSGTFSLAQDRPWIATRAPNRVIQVSEAVTGEKVWAYDIAAENPGVGLNYLPRFTLSPSGRCLAVQIAQNEIVLVWRDAMQPPRRISLKVPFSGLQSGLHFSPDERVFIARAGATYVLRLDEPAASPVTYQGEAAGFVAFDFCGDGSRFVSRKIDGYPELFDTRTMQRIATLDSPWEDGGWILGCGPGLHRVLDATGGSGLTVWETDKPRARVSVPFESWGYGRLVRYMGKGETLVVHRGSHKPGPEGLFQLDSEAPARFHWRDGRLALSPELKVPDDFGRLHYLGTDGDTLHFVADGEYLAESNVRNRTIRGPFYRFDSLSEAWAVTELQTAIQVSSAPALNPKKPQAACGGPDGSVYLIDLDTGMVETCGTKHELPVWDIRFSPDGTWLASSEGKFNGALPGDPERSWRVLVHRVDSPELSAKRLTPPSDPEHRSPGGPQAWCLEFSPDSATLAVGSDRGRFALWDVDAGTMRGEYPSSGVLVRSMTFSPDGELLVLAASDQLDFWHVPTQRTLLSLPGPDPNTRFNCVAFSPDGLSLAYTSGYGFDTSHLNVISVPPLPNASSNQGQ